MDETKFAEGVVSDEELAAVSGGDGPGSFGIYIVQKGDTLRKLAYKYGISLGRMMEINNTDNPGIRVGQAIIVPLLE